MVTVELTFEQMLDAVNRLPTAERQRLIVEAAAAISLNGPPDSKNHESAPFAPDTDVPLSADELASALKRLGPLVPAEIGDISADPDDYPLF